MGAVSKGRGAKERATQEIALTEQAESIKPALRKIDVDFYIECNIMIQMLYRLPSDESSPP